MIRAGLFLYDHLDRKQTLPKSTTLHIQDMESEPLKSLSKVTYQYSDGAVDDSRLVVTNAQMARAGRRYFYPPSGTQGRASQ